MSEKTTQITLDDDDVVTVDVSDHPDLAAAATEAGAAPTGAPAAAQTATPPSDETTAALSEAVKSAQEARRAAEATAASERAAREAAEREARARAAEAEAARTEVQDRELTILTSGLEQAKARQEAAEQAWQRAMEAGDYAAAAKAQTAGQNAAAEVAQLTTAKATLEAAPPAKKAPPTTEGRVAPQAADRVEQYLANFTAKSQTWLRAHPDCLPAEIGGDAKKNAQMMAAHYAAVAEGLAPESEEYFKVIEEKTGIRQPETAPEPTSKAAETHAAAPAEPKPAPARKPAPPSAPVSRDAPAVPGQRLTRQVTLNAQQKEAAQFSFPHLPASEAWKAYARNLLELEAEGKMGRQAI